MSSSRSDSTDKVKPDWAGQDWLSRCVNLLIKTKPLYAVMTHQARQVLIKTAEKNGIPWRKNYQELEASNVKSLLEKVQQPVTYPDYYQVPFHAYAAGNLCWPAAFEAESATYSMALRTWPKENLTWKAAQARLRSSFHEVIAEHGPNSVKRILDIGCSVGISTLALTRFYPQAKTIGLDLSPHMLSVAKLRDTQGEISEWRHAKAEETGLENQSLDLVTLQYVIHELPRQATAAIFQEVYRILDSGGCIALVDLNPKSPVIQSLPPQLFTLMKSTEPWSDDYYTFDVEAALQDTGFDNVETVASDPRHRTIIAKKT